MKIECVIVAIQVSLENDLKSVKKCYISEKCQKLDELWLIQVNSWESERCQTKRENLRIKSKKKKPSVNKRNKKET